MRPDDMADGKRLGANLLRGNARDRDRLILGTDDPQNVDVAAYRKLSPDEERARKRRILATGLALAAFAVLVFVVSMARLQTNIGAGGAG